MRKISGFCESCENYSPFLENRRGLWLCTLCRDRKNRLDKMIPERIENKMKIFEKN